MICETKIFIFKHFDMKDLDEVLYVLGLKIYKYEIRVLWGFHNKHILVKFSRDMIWNTGN